MFKSCGVEFMGKTMAWYLRPDPSMDSDGFVLVPILVGNHTLIKGTYLCG